MELERIWKESGLRSFRGISLEGLEKEENLRVSGLGTAVRTSDIINTNELV